MTTTERLALHREVERRNDDRIKGGFLKYQKITNNLRVVIEPAPFLGKDKYWISAQQYAPDCPRPWEVRPDGWRETSGRTANGYESALRVFERVVADERRYAEMR